MSNLQPFVFCQKFKIVLNFCYSAIKNDLYQLLMKNSSFTELDTFTC